MCGIAGELAFGSAPAPDGWIQRACAILRHRGPDGEGFHRDGGLALGHRRLSIIDLTRGAQPMSFARGRYWITFNGEIYNYREVRAELRALGHEFQTDSDTEVILAAYHAWGVASLPRLDGIFAFGLWDAQTRELLLARDALGVKPLLYQQDQGGVRFASELKPLLEHPAVGRAVDPEGLEEYLALGYTLTPRTLIRGVRKLPPGHSLLVRDGPGVPAPYWDPAPHAREGASDRRPEREVVEQLGEQLDRTVRMQMVSDVPLGTFLSGGIDSSTITYYASRHASGPLETFSIGFEEASFDESAYSSEVAALLGTEHHLSVAPAPSPEELDRLVWYYDEPLGDTSIVPTYYLARCAKERVKVALSGDGADELLAGYDTYIADRLQSLYARAPDWVHRVVRPGVRLIPSSYRKVSLDFKVKQFVEHAAGSSEQAHYGWRSMLNESERAELSGRPASAAPFESYARHYEAVRDASPLNQSLYVDVKTWLLDDVLVKVDRSSMACSLEVRVPFLAPGFVAAAMRLPAELKLRNLTRKYALKKLMRDRLPRRVLHRKKRGFNAPVSVWMRGALHDHFTQLMEEHASSLVDLGSPLWKRLWREHCSGEVDHGYKLWTVLSLVLWERNVLA
jgi:asparagine synthase (glutamine-hydrolysing)